MKFTELNGNLKGGLAPIYLVQGEEVYFRDHAVEAIRKACALNQPTLNDVRYEGETLKGEKLTSFRDELYSAPFFDEKRLVRAYRFYPTEKEWGSVFEKYVASPCPTTVLVIVNEGKKAGGVDLARRKGIVYVDCGKESEETLTRWGYNVMRRAGLNADADAAALLVQYTSSSAARIKSEAEKLALILGEGGRVTRSVIEEYVSKDIDYKIYELTQAAANGRSAAFAEIYGDFVGKGADETFLLGALVSYFRTLLECSLLTGTDEEVAKQIGSKPHPVKKNRETARRLGARVQKYYEELYALSAGMRAGELTKSGALYEAVAKIFFGLHKIT